MLPYTVTFIHQLQTGDRFYRLKDKKKEVWEKVEGEVKKTYFQTYRHFAKRDNDKFYQPFQSATAVVFLRHKQTAHAQVS